MSKTYCGYIRVSTGKQQDSGLGLEAQAASIKRFIDANGGTVAHQFLEVESGKKTASDRPELEKAIALCKKHGYILLVPYLARLARSVYFTACLQRSGIQFVAIDNQYATPFIINILAAVAEQDLVTISTNTRAALAQARIRLQAQGRRLGNPDPTNAGNLGRAANTAQANDYSERLLPVIQEIQRANVKSLRKIAHCLNVRGFVSRTGRPFAAQTVKNILDRSQS